MKKEHRKDVICRILAVISALFIAWVLFSVIDTNIHNTSDFNYSNWNFFRVIMNLHGGVV